jgi:hypothetical protein
MLQGSERLTTHFIKDFTFFSGPKLINPSLLVAFLLVKGQFLPLLSVPAGGSLLSVSRARFILLASVVVLSLPMPVTVRLLLFLFIARAALPLLRRLGVELYTEILPPPISLTALAFPA